MPLVYQQYMIPDIEIGVWHITEDEKYFTDSIKIENAITHPRKRLQHVAGRYLLQILFKDFPLHRIEVTDARKPFVEGDGFYFSVSHCGNYVAAAVSMQGEVGVDVEKPTDTILRVAPKFMTEKEQELSHEMEKIIYQTLVWSAKEAVFKWYGKGNLDFRKHMQITSVEKSGLFYKVHMHFSREENKELELMATIVEGHVLCWVHA